MTNNRKKDGLLKRVARLFLAVIIGFYLVVCITMAIAQRSLIYHPHVYASAQVDRIARSVNLERWTNSDGEDIGFKRLSPTQPVTGSILISYGNGGMATGCAHYADDIQTVAAMDIYILEYPGYADRPGPTTENTLFATAANALQMIPTNQPVYLVGESLGSGVACYLAGTFTNRIDGIVLLSPFTSVTDVGQYRYPFLPVSVLAIDRFPSKEYLHNYHGKVGITVDGQDVVVPERFGLRLYNSYNGPKTLWEYPDGHHCQIDTPPTVFWKKAVAFWQSNGG
ncbi:MAG TPA: alpha/beta fold hydrolase [Verrucomicrobiae bacterium]